MDGSVCDLKAGAAGLRLLPADALVVTSEVDHADWNFRPVVGNVIRLRYQMLQQIIKDRDLGRTLEIGYGSGVLLPHLARQAGELHGIDPHHHIPEVNAVLTRFGVRANLISGTATKLPYPDRYFDTVIAVSSLEFIGDLQQACQELSRVIRPGGMLAVVTPGESRLVDLGLKLLTGASPQRDFGDRRKKIIPTLLGHFEVRKRIDRPRFLHRMVRLYTAVELTPR